MTLNSTRFALEESYDILGDFGYPVMDKAAEEMNLPPDFSTWFAAVRRGWAEEGSGVVKITSVGKQVRAQARSADGTFLLRAERVHFASRFM